MCLIGKRGARRVALALVACVCAVRCSSGDRDPFYLACVAADRSHRSGVAEDRSHRSGIEEAAYRCMHAAAERRLGLGLPALQYHGHWPFRRALGLQEPAACLFSLLNAAPHLLRLRSYRSYRSYGSYGSYGYLSPWLLAYTCVHLVAWLCSAAYHRRRTAHTAMADYAAALALVTLSCACALRALLGPDSPGSPRRRDLLCLLLFLPPSAAQLALLLLGRVSHGAHLEACVRIAALHALLWLLWLLTPHSRSHRALCMLCNALLLLAAAFEVLDFPPVEVAGLQIDAHALWHLCTAPLSLLWYRLWDRLNTEHRTQAE